MREDIVKIPNIYQYLDKISKYFKYSVPTEEYLNTPSIVELQSIIIRNLFKKFFGIYMTSSQSNVLAYYRQVSYILALFLRYCKLNKKEYLTSQDIEIVNKNFRSFVLLVSIRTKLLQPHRFTPIKRFFRLIAWFISSKAEMSHSMMWRIITGDKNYLIDQKYLTEIQIKKIRSKINGIHQIYETNKTKIQFEYERRLIENYIIFIHSFFEKFNFYITEVKAGGSNSYDHKLEMLYEHFKKYYIMLQNNFNKFLINKNEEDQNE